MLYNVGGSVGSDQNNMTYFCELCGHIEAWNAQLIADKGEPVCPDCDNDMKLQPEKTCNSCGARIINGMCDAPLSVAD